MITGLTRRQRDCLNYIEARYQTDGVPPSFQEMMEHLGLHSKSGVARIINALEERGAISRLKNRARAIMPNISSTISVRLPAEIENRLRLVAATANTTPENVIASMVKERLVILADKANSN